MKTLFTILFLLAFPCLAHADITGVYKGETGQITIRKADNLRVIRVKPGFENEYNMGFQGEFYTAPENLPKLKKRFTDTGKTPGDAYLVSFDMGKNPDCRLTWKNEPAQFDGEDLRYRDTDGRKWFTLRVSGDTLELDMPMGWVRSNNNQCMSVERFYKD